VSGVTEGNLTAVQKAIAQTAQDGSGVDSLSELQQVVDAARQGSEQALGVIRAYAQTHSGTVPTVQTYADAGAADVNADNLDSINSALASAAVTGDSVATLSQVQALVQAFNRLRSLADGQDNTTSVDSPGAASYALLGVEGVDAGNNRVYKARLLGDVLDLKALTDMDSVVKLQGLANAVATVVGAAGGGTAPTLAQLQSLGLQDLSADNMPAVVAAIANTADDGEGVSTLVQLQALVTQASGAAALALQVIGAYAQNNGGTVPTLMHYTQAGVSGVSLGHLDALNDALASATVTAASVDSTLKLQTLVDTYLAILQLADGQNNTDSTQSPAAESYARVGVVGVDSAGQARLLGDVLDLQTPSAVDRVPKIQVLADAAKAVLTGAQGGAVPTMAQLQALGVQSLDANNILAVQDAIAASSAEQVSTLEGLQAVVNNAAGSASVALAAIRAYAQDNGASAPAPTEVQYRAAGVTGVTATQVASINSALASASVDADSVSNTAKLQALVNAFQSVLRLADGLDNTPTTDNPTTSAYGLIGITGVDSAAKASLLGDVLDLQQPQNASLVPSIQTLADAAAAVVQGAAGQLAPTLAQLQALGVSQVTADNLPAIARAIAATPDNGSGVNSLQKLQTLVTEAATEAANALLIIRAYAQDNSGTAPTLNDFARAGVTGVTGLNLAFVNDALASDSVTGASVGTTAQVQNLVQASLAVQTLADGLDNTPTAANPTQGQYSLVGVSGVDSPFKARLLGDVLDIQLPSDADTVNKIQSLAESVNAVMRTAAAGSPVSLEQLLSLRLMGLSADNLVAVQNAIANTRDDGQDVDTLQKLQALVNSAVGARAAALAIIGDYAEQNVVSAPASPMGTAPTLQDYVNAGVRGVQAGNLACLNDALATAPVTRASVDSTGKVQALVQAYSGILALADGGVATGTPVSASAYALLGLTGVNTGSESAVKADLLSSVIDGKTTADVDTVAKIQALANAAAAVISGAAGSVAPTLAQLQALGLSSVNADNLPVVLKAIADTADDGSGVRTLGQLQSVSTQAIDAAISALQVISSYAQTNTGTAPTLAHYSQAGVTGASADNLASLNDALASASVQGTSVDSTPKLQALVNAYQAILALADGVDNTANTNNPAAAQYALVGVNGVDSPVKTSLLGDVIDGMSQTAVNTVPKLQTLADAVAAVMSGAANAAGPSLAQWQALGVTGVNADNLKAVQDKLAATADDGSAVDTLTELQNLVNSAQTGAAAALSVIRAYAQSNTGLVPTEEDYANAGVVGVNSGNLARINSALASPTVVGASVDTSAKVQALVDASQAIFGLADGTNNTATAANPDMGAYGLIGVTGVDSAVKASLLGDVLDTRASDSVPTVVEVQQLANAVAAVVATAALNNASAGAALSMAQLQLLGLSGVTADNLPAIVNAIALSADDASAVATADALQSLVLNAANAAASALQVIGNYAQANSGPIPSVDDYALAGVRGVTAGNLSSINDALASASVNAASVATTTQVQDLVNAYNRVLTMADGLDNTAHGANPSASEYALMGVTGVDSAPKTGLLGDVIDLKAQPEVDTVQDIQALADAVAAVMAGAAGVSAPTLAHLASLGMASVNQDNLKAVQEAIAATANDGSGVASLPALQAVVSSAVGDVAGALGIISSYAQNNSGTTPQLLHYRNAAVTGVTPENLAAINSALASGPVVGTSVDTTAELQALVDAYVSVLQLADGQAGSGPALGATPYSLIGVSGLDLSASTAAALKQALIHSVVDLRTADQVDTLSEIDNLVKIANAIQELASGQTPSYTLQAPDFAAIGVTGVSQANLSQVLQAIGVAQASGADSVGKLQALVHSSLSLVLTGIDADTGVSATDRITRDNTLTLHGTSSAADDTPMRVTLQASSGTSKTLWATVQGGIWRAVDTAGPLPDGVYAVDVALVNGQQQVIRSAPTSSITIDTSASSLPDGTADTALIGHTISLAAIDPDRGANNADFMTDTGSLVFRGTSTAPNGTHVALNIAGVVVYTQVNNGQWSVDRTAHNLANGPHNVSVALVDAAGNAVHSDQKLVVIDNSAVRITSKTTGSIASTADLVLYFSDDITAQDGKFIRIIDESTNTEFEAISVTDSTRVTVVGNTVTLNPSADLVVGKTYHATIDNGAFKSSTTTFAGLSSPTDWTFRPVDASTSVNWAGVGVQSSNGISATELSALEVSGTLISANIGSVVNPVIDAITFKADDGSSFVIASGLPSIDPVTRSWTLAHNASWVSQLVSGKSYTVSVDLSAEVNNVQTTTTAQGQTTLIDSTAPTLSITSSAAQLKAGESATLTFSFSEAPVGFAVSDINHPNGSLTGFAVTADPKVYTAVFTPNINLTGSLVPVSVSAGVYGDAVGNPGGAASAPQLAIDTQIPSVLNREISGADSTGAPKTGDLVTGDKLRVTLTLSEPTNVTGTPTWGLDLGGVNKSATYISGSGTNTLVFEYTIATGDNDLAGGITAAADALTLADARMQDAAGNTADTRTAAITNGTNSVRVDTTATALQNLQNAAQNNSASGVTTPVSVYTRAGVSGVSADNLDALNSALNSADVTGADVSTTAQLQGVVDAWNGVLNLADGGTSKGAPVTAAQWRQIGVAGVDSVTPGASAVSSASKARLLSDTVDSLARASADSVDELQSLAQAVQAVMVGAAGGTAPTRAQLQTLGITGVTDANLSAVQAAIAATPDTGASVDSREGLQFVVTSAANATTAFALAHISGFAGDNSVSAPAAPRGTPPSLIDYANANVTGVTADNLAQINDALATALVTRAASDTTAKLQAIVDAYADVRALADGTPGNGNPVSAQQLGLIGAEIGSASDTASHLRLLNEVLDRESGTGVDTVAEITQLASITSAIQTQVAGQSHAHRLTAADFSRIGLSGVTSGNLQAVLDSLALKPDDGLGTDSLAKLQKLITTATAAPLSVSLVNDTGSSNSDGTSSDNRLSFGGTVLADGTRYYSLNGAPYSTTYTAPTSQGAHTVSVKQIDSAGNSGQVTTLKWVYDDVAPNVTLSGLALSADTGILDNDFVTNTAAQTVTGTLSANLLPGDILWGSVNGGTDWQDITSQVSGTSLVWTGVNLSGSSNLLFKVRDLAGNEGSPIGLQAYRVDTEAPSNPLSLVQLSNDTGTSTADGVTKMASQTITANLSAMPEAGSSLWGTIDGGTRWVHVTSKISGLNLAWDGVTLSSDISPQQIAFKWVDIAGNESSLTGLRAYVFDTSAPSVTVGSVGMSADTGTHLNDFVTKTTVQTITARLSAPLQTGDKLWGSVNGGSDWIDLSDKVIGQQITWNGAALLAGQQSMAFKVSDLAGNETGLLGVQGYTLDTTPPNLTVAGVQISEDTAANGQSNNDFVTRIPDQTITASLSGALASTDRLFGSVNNGGDWMDITSKVNGSTISWSGARLSGTNSGILFKLVDLAGNETGGTGARSYVLDAQAPSAEVQTVSFSNITGSEPLKVNVAEQDLLGTLSAPLGNGETVYVSMNDGQTWSAANTLGSNWRLAGLTLSGTGKLHVKVTDLAGNDGPVARHDYSFDATQASTTITSAQLSNDSAPNGDKNTDFNTNVALQTLEGALSAPLESGERVQVSLDGGANWQNATTTVGRSIWSLADVTLQGSNSLQVKVTDAMGNDGPVFSRSYTLDTSRPLNTIASLSFSDDSAPNGTTNSDFITKIAGQTLSGTLASDLASDERVFVSFNNGQYWLQANVNQRAWSVTGINISSGNPIWVKVTDLAGNDGPVFEKTYTFDIAAPTQKFSSLAFSADTGSSDKDFITAAIQQTITAVLSAELSAGDKVWGSLDNGSNWLDITAQVQGQQLSWQDVSLTQSNTLVLKVTDAAGNDGTALRQAYVLETSTPSQTFDAVSLSADTGISSTDFITREAGQTITATLSAPLAAGDRVWGKVDSGQWILLNDFVIGSTLSWSGVTLPSSGILRLKATNAAGNDGPVFEKDYVLDTVAPSTGAATLNMTGDSAPHGATNSDFVTRTPTQVLFGTLTANLAVDERVLVSLDNGLSWAAASATPGQNSWGMAGVNLASISASNRTFHVRVSDAAGNFSSPAYSQTYVLDTQAPDVSITSVVFSADTAPNDTTNTDLRTRMPAQTISGSLSRGLLSGETVYVSLNDGGSWQAATTGQGSDAWTLSGVALASTNWLRVKVTDVAGNDGPVDRRNYVLDITPPNVSVGSVSLSADTGASSSDFITSQADQTISATLSAAPGTGEVLYGSLDNGTTWTDLTNFLSSTALSWTGVRLSGSNTLMLKVTDQVGNDGPIFSQAYNLVSGGPAAAVFSVSLSADTAVNNTTNNDFVTRTALQNLSGTLTANLLAGDVVQVSLNGGTSWLNATAATGANTWGLNGITLPGSITLKARVINGSGVSSTEFSRAITLDTEAPTTASGIPTLSSDTAPHGAFNSDRVTKSPTQTIEGQLTAPLLSGETVQVSLDAGGTWQAANIAAGQTLWRLPGVSLTGSGVMHVKVSDLAGNNGPIEIRSYTLDTTGPNIVVYNPSLSDDTAPHATRNSDFVTKTSGQTLTATLTGVPVNDERLYGSLDNGTTWTDLTGSLIGTTLTWSGLNLSGNNVLQLKVSDSAGNDGPVLSRTYKIDQTAPSATVGSLSLSQDTAANGLSNSDFVTRTAAQTVSAVLSSALQDGEKLYGSLNNGQSWTDLSSLLSGNTLTWSGVTLSGSNTLRLKVTDPAGNDGTVTSQPYTVDQSPPTTRIASASFSTDTGPNNTSNGDFVTRQASQTLGGTLSANLTAGETVFVSMNNGTSWTAASTTVGQNTWSLAGLTLSGTNTFKVKVSDLAGNDGLVLSETYELDTTVPTAQVATVTFSNDTGTAGDLNTTVASQTISGTLSAALGANETVYVSLNNGSTWRMATANAGDTSWSLEGITLTGSNTLHAKVADKAGNESTPLQRAYVFDSVLPTVSISAVSFSADTAANGTTNADFVTFTRSQTIRATLSAMPESDEALWGSLDGGTNWVNLNASLSPTANGASLSWITTLSGSGTLQLKVQDVRGNNGPLYSQAYVLDEQGPATTVATAAFSVDTGTPGDFNTTEDDQTISGTLSAVMAAGEAVYVSLDNGSNWQQASTLVGSNAWRLEGVKLTGSNTFKVKVTDQAGNNGAVFEQAYVLNNNAPTGTWSALAFSADTAPNGTTNNDFVTQTAAQTIRATLSEPLGTQKKVWGSLDNGSTWTDITASVTNTSLNWAVTLSGSNTLRIQLRDVGGNVGNGITQAYVLDTTAPSKAMASIALSDDTGTPGDFNTTNPSQTISGTLTANLAEGEQVYVSINNGINWQLATATVGSNAWSLGSQTLSGSGTLKVKVTDLAGNDGAVLGQNFEINSSAPTASITSVSFTADTAPHGGSNTDLVTRTANQVVFGTVSANLASGEAVYVSLDGGTTFMAASGAAGQNTWSLSGVTLNNGSQNLLLEVRNLSGSAGPRRTQAYVLDTDAPTTTVATATLGNDSGASTSDGVTRFASQNLSGTLSGNLQAGDTVYVSLDNGLNWLTATASVGSPNWSLASATLVAGSTVLVKVSDAAGNQTASLPLTYTLDTEAPGTTIASVAFSADTAPANGSNSDLVTRTAAQTVSGTLSANLASGEQVLVSLDNGTNWLPATSTVGQASWSLASQTLLGSNTLRVKVQDLAGNDGPVRLEAYTLDTNAPTTLSGITITPAGGTVEANALNKTNTGVIFSATLGAGEATGGAAHFYVGSTLVGVDSDIAAGDNRVNFSINSALQSAITAGGVVSVQLFDRAGNLLSANGPSLAVRYNDAPVLDVAKTPSLNSIDTTTQSAVPTGAVGSLVSTLVGTTGIANFSDADGSANVGLAITGYDTSKGTLHYSTNGGSSWTTWSAPAGEALHLAANANTRVYFRANAAATGDAGLIIRAWDQSNALANGVSAALSGTGGSHAYSATTDNVDLALYQRAYTPGGLSRSLAIPTYLGGIGNFNGDGFMDVSLVRFNDWNLTIHWGKTTALSTTADNTYYLPRTAFSNTMLDINGDGYADVVNGNSNDVSPNGARFGFFLGRAQSTTGSLGSGTEVSTGFKPNIGRGAGDFNGDGFEDVLVSNSYDQTISNEGTVAIYFGNASATGFTTLTYSASIGFGAHAAKWNFGDVSGVAHLGDTNRDGMADLAIGNYLTGQVFVKLGTTSTSAWSTPTPTGTTPTGWVVSGLRTGVDSANNIGLNVSSAGDVNGDGLSDLLVMDPVDSAAYVIYGQPNGSMANLNVSTLTQSQGFKISVSNTAWRFGISGGNIGDVNADGYDDVFIGAPAMGSRGGGVLVFGGATLAHGNLNALDSSGWTRTVDATTLTSSGTLIGRRTGPTAGDINGDGLSDFLVAGSETLVIYGDTNMASGLNLNPLISGNLAMGTSAAERLLGTAGIDTLFTGGGADAVSAGAGNDTVLVRDTGFVRIDGGLGIDTFRLDSSVSNMTLDVSLLADKLRGIEHFDLKGGGDNTLRITLSDLLHMPDAVNTNLTTSNINEAQMVLVTGNLGDKLQVNPGGTWNVITLSAADQSALTGAGYQFEAGRSYRVLSDSSRPTGHAFIYDSAIGLSTGMDGTFVYY
jgi:hypothetical protein